ASHTRPPAYTYTLSLHDALPISPTVATNTDTIMVRGVVPNPLLPGVPPNGPAPRELFDGEFVTVMVEGVEPITVLAIPRAAVLRSEEHTSELQSRGHLVCRLLLE